MRFCIIWPLIAPRMRFGTYAVRFCIFAAITGSWNAPGRRTPPSMPQFGPDSYS